MMLLDVAPPRLRGRRRLGAGGRRPVRGDGLPPPGRGPLPLRGRRRAGRRRGGAGRPRYRRPPAGARSWPRRTTGSAWSPRRPAVDGHRAPLRPGSCAALTPPSLLRGLATASYPVYMYLSNRGELFVPAMDTAAFPPLGAPGRPDAGGALAEPAGLRPARPGAAALMRPQERPASAASCRPPAQAMPRPGAGHRDSRALVRSLFLASAIRTGLLDALRDGPPSRRSPHETGCTRPERLRAWLTLAPSWARSTGARAGTGCAGSGPGPSRPGTSADAHYRSMLDYQAEPLRRPREPAAVSAPSEGRADLDSYADDIAQVSLAATPFIASYLTSVIAETRPATGPRRRMRHRRSTPDRRRR